MSDTVCNVETGEVLTTAELAAEFLWLEDAQAQLAEAKAIVKRLDDGRGRGEIPDRLIRLRGFVGEGERFQTDTLDVIGVMGAKQRASVSKRVAEEHLEELVGMGAVKSGVKCTEAKLGDIEPHIPAITRAFGQDFVDRLIGRGGRGPHGFDVKVKP